jgi:uncharacterized protein YqeY
MIIDTIKKDRIEAIKSGDSFKNSTLTTLLSEVQRLDKSDQKSDQKVLEVIRKYNKSLNEMIVLTLPREGDPILVEKDIISVYLPKQLSGEELDLAIEEIITEVGAETMKDMGKVMKALKETFDGQYDGKVASGIVRSLLP